MKIGDFGASKETRDDTELRTYTGTKPYMAPEILFLLQQDESWKPYTTAVDLWSLGVIAFELICGKRPFGNLRNFREIEELKAYCDASRYAPEKTSLCRDLLAKGMRPEVAFAILKLLAPDPRQRIAANEMLVTFKRAIEPRVDPQLLQYWFVETHQWCWE